MRDEAAIERRLEREARTVKLGTITTSFDPVENVARVEVSWAHDDEEHAGHYIVRMPGHVDPWQEAGEAAADALERRYPDADYRSVDDIYAV